MEILWRNFSINTWPTKDDTIIKSDLDEKENEE